MLELVLRIEGREPRVVIVGASGSILLGRSRDCDVVLEHESVSGRHAVIGFDGGRVWIEDRGSTNGTWVNGARAERGERAPLATGDVLRLGSATVDVVRIGAEDPPISGSGSLLEMPTAVTRREMPTASMPEPSAPVQLPRPRDAWASKRGTWFGGLLSGVVRKVSNLFRRSGADDVAWGEPVDAPAATAPPDEPASEPAATPVRLGVSAPRRVVPGREYVFRFTAHVPEASDDVRALLRGLSPQATTHLGMKTCRWAVGTDVVVRLDVRGFAIDEPVRQFTWRGDTELLSFDVVVPDDTPIGTVIQKLDVFVAGVRVAALRVDVEVTDDVAAGDEEPRVAETDPADTAFASYASADRARVLDRVASIRQAAGLDVFVDCVSLRTGDRWQDALRQEILDRDVFLLFWSANARDSEWVTFELETALDEKGEDVVQLHPLASPDDAPPPDRLAHLQFGDPLMLVRDAIRNRGTSVDDPSA